MDLARERARVSMTDWTEERGRSATSRQVEESERSERVRVLELEGVEVVRVLREVRIVASDLRRFLNGRAPSDSSSEELGSARRRFLLSAIVESEREAGKMGGERGGIGPAYSQLLDLKKYSSPKIEMRGASPQRRRFGREIT